MLTTLIRHARNETGVAMIEMALVLPLLLMLLFGIVDFARALNYWNDANQIAADGARFAAVNRNPGSDAGLTLQEWLERQADTAELAGTSPTSSVPASKAIKVCIEFPGLDPGAEPKVGDPVKVNVKAGFNLMPVVDTDGPGAVKLEGSATMRLEQVPTNFVADCAP